MKKCLSLTAAALVGAAVWSAPASRAAEPAVVTARGTAWALQNEALRVQISFADGRLALGGFENRAAGTDYLEGRAPAPLFSFALGGDDVTAADGRWSFSGAEIDEIGLFGKHWGRRLTITMARKEPARFSVRQVLELYDGGGGLRMYAFVRNETDHPLALGASDVLALNLPDRPHQVHYVTGNLMWNVGTGGVQRVGRNLITRYDTGDGWFVVPENNWATCLVPGGAKGNPAEKLLHLYAWDGEPNVRVSTNPKAVQLTLFPREEVEYFTVNLGVFKGDGLDGRAAVAEHLRHRFKYHNPEHVLSVNDWQWGNGRGRRTDKNYREIVVPQAQAAGFDRVLIDDGWYAPDDSTTPKRNWTDMASLGQYINDHGLQAGHWFSLQGRFCSRGWGEGRDAADPANIDFKLKQMEEELIGKYRTSWDQVDAGLLWKTDAETAYSHPLDSVYRKILGMKRYMNAIAHKYPDFIMQTTCEIDNPSGAATHGEGAQNVGLIQLADNGIMGMFRRSEYADDVRDLFAAYGLFPLEGMLSTHGEDGIRADSWQDSPLWYYQFLLARHTMIYSWPGDWSAESVAHLRVFNDWRKNPRIAALLREGARPVYNGPDAVKNEGPWCWMFTDEARTRALVFAINHRELNRNNAFDAKLRWLDGRKSYLVEEITQLPDATFNFLYRGEFSGAQLQEKGLPIDLDAGEERCVAFWIQEKVGQGPQVLYADAAVTHVDALHLQGRPQAVARVMVCKPDRNGVEDLTVTLDARGQATIAADDTTVTQIAGSSVPAGATASFAGRDLNTLGAWRGKYGATAAWLAGRPLVSQNGFSLRLQNGTTYVWGLDDQAARVLDRPAGVAGPKQAACWTANQEFDLRVKAPADARSYRLTVYLMDYDNVRYPARAMEVALRCRDGKVLDARQASKAETGVGVYLTWTVSGNVVIHARKTEGFNAAVSGVFMDLAPADVR